MGRCSEFPGDVVGKLWENHGKSWKIMGKSWKIMENSGKIMEKRGCEQLPQPMSIGSTDYLVGIPIIGHNNLH